MGIGAAGWGRLVDDGDGFVFLLENPNELEEIVTELTAGAAYGMAPVVGSRGRDLIEAVADARREGRQKLRGGSDRTPRMAAIATPATFVTTDITGDDARRRFLDDDTLTTLVYTDERLRPIGALGRERLFRMFSGQYGYAVFANRPILEAADPHPRVIEADVTIVEAAITVANRDSDSLFDDVLVVDAGGSPTQISDETALRRMERAGLTLTPRPLNLSQDWLDRGQAKVTPN